MILTHATWITLHHAYSSIPWPIERAYQADNALAQDIPRDHPTLEHIDRHLAEAGLLTIALAQTIADARNEIRRR